MSEAPTLEELARRARAGSTHAFAELVGRLERPLFHFLALRTGCAADAEELTQAAFVRAWRKLALYDDRWAFSTWLFTIARREAVSQRRANARHTDRRALQEVSELHADGPEPGDAMAARERSDGLWELATRLLNAEQRSALWLRYAEDMTPMEIGRVLAKQPTTIRVMLWRARRALAQHLQAEFDDDGGTRERHPLHAMAPDSLAGES